MSIHLPNIIKKSVNEKGLAPVIIVVIILAALALGIYLVQNRTNINPFASVSGPISGPSTTLDSDADGFSDVQETFMGTNTNKGCPDNKFDNAWPVDVNNDKYVNGGDVSTLVPFINGTNPYGRRYDLNQDNLITASDVSVIQANFLKTCVPIEKTATLRVFQNQTVTLGQNVEVGVSLSVYPDDVNLVSAQLNYPADKLEIVNINVEGDNANTGGLNSLVEKYGANGQISIVKGSTQGVNTGSINVGLIFAKITFKTKSVGTSEVTINRQTSEVLRVSDGANILKTSADTDFTSKATITVNPVATPTPSPVVTPKPTPVAGCTSDTQCGSGKVCRRYQDYPGNCMDEFLACAQALVTACDTTVPNGVCVVFPNSCVVPPGWSATPSRTPSPSATAQPTASASIAPTPNPTPVAVIPCSLTKAEWTTAGLVPSNTTATLRVEATGNCTNRKVVFKAWEDDGLLGADPVFAGPQSVILINAGQPNLFVASTTWRTEFQEDGPFGTSYPPEYLFEASLENEPASVRSLNQLTVARELGVPSPLEGDTNKDQVVNLRDVSWLLANWNQSVQDDSLDLDGDDNYVNNFDMTKLKNILLQRGVLRAQ